MAKIPAAVLVSLTRPGIDLPRLFSLKFQTHFAKNSEILSLKKARSTCRAGAEFPP